MTEQDSQTVRVDSMDGGWFQGRRDAAHLYQDPENRRSVQLIVRPLVECHLDRLVIRDSSGDLAEITKDEAYLRSWSACWH